MRVNALNEAHHHAEESHLIAGGAALAAAVLGAWFAYAGFSMRRPTVAELTPPPTGLRAFLHGKWYFDELYDALFRKPTVRAAVLAADADKRRTDTPNIDLGTLDGWLNAVGQATQKLGVSLKAVQTGRVRGYVLVLALTVVGLLGMLVGLTL